MLAVTNVKFSIYTIANGVAKVVIIHIFLHPFYLHVQFAMLFVVAEANIREHCPIVALRICE